jgi:hypothetical protein
MEKTITIKAANIGKIIAELRQDARFNADWQKEIGLRVGRPNAEGNYSFTLGVVGLMSWACTTGFFDAPRWYESTFAKFAE